MEIERKYLIDPDRIPFELSAYPHMALEQGYLCTAPVVRVRKEGTEYVLTYKGGGLLAREEYNLPLTEEAYLHLKEKADGRIISKTRYRIPMADTDAGEGQEDLLIELDVFSSPRAGLHMAEVEFPDRHRADTFSPPSWFGEEVTFDPAYHNSVMSRE